MSKQGVSAETSLAILQDILRSLMRDDGLPLTEEQERQLPSLIHAIPSDKLASLGLSPPPRPSRTPRVTDKSLPIQERLISVQGIINSLTYNHQKGYLFNVDKTRTFSRIMDTAQEVLKEALPIKCIEAVFLGAFLTSGWSEISRLPLGFKSSVGGHVHRHIVLVIHHPSTGQWGALGISRRHDLMDKKLEFTSLSSLVHDYLCNYQAVGHKLLKARIGLPFEHDVLSNSPICWRFLSVSPQRSWPEAEQQLAAFEASYKTLEKKMRVLGSTPPPPPSLRNTLTHEEASTSSPSSKVKKGGPGVQVTSVSPLKHGGESESEEDEGEYDEASDG